MKTYPVDKDKPVEGWFCDYCDHKVTFKQRNQVYREVIAQVKQRYNLKTLTHQEGYWNIQSNEWSSIDGSRHNSKRKRLTADERFDIKFDVLDSLQDKLGVYIGDTELDNYWLQ